MAILPSDLLDGNGKPLITVIDVTPDMARKWLERNIGNRPVSSVVVGRYAKDMAAGDWKMTGDPIRFSKTGKLIDGQHRLNSIIQSGATIRCVVMQDLSDEIFDVLDSGKSRGKVDVLFIELGLPVETCKVLSTAASLLIDYERGQYGFMGKADKREVIEFVKRNPSVIASAELSQKWPKHTPVPKSIGAAFHFHASLRDPQGADRFMERFMAGVVNDANDNLLYMRERCYAASVSRRPIHRSHVLRGLIRIWNAEQRGRPIKYAANALRADDAFPTFI